MQVLTVCSERKIEFQIFQMFCFSDTYVYIYIYIWCFEFSAFRWLLTVATANYLITWVGSDIPIGDLFP